jgi:hypothetical protein
MNAWGLLGTETLPHFEPPPQEFNLKSAYGSWNKKRHGFLFPTTS